jgi:hypothetical protein
VRARNPLFTHLYSTLRRTSQHSGGARNRDTLFIRLVGATCVAFPFVFMFFIMLLSFIELAENKGGGICVWYSEPLFGVVQLILKLNLVSRAIMLVLEYVYALNLICS